MEAATARQGLRVFCSAAALCGVVISGCTANVTVEVKPSDCINPPTGDCHGANESRILEVRLYQLKQPLNACQLDLEAFAQGKDLEALAGALVESQRSDDVRLSFKVAPGEPRSVGTWKILRNASHVLAVAIGRGRSKNSIRLIPVDRVKNGWHLPKLYFEGYDICLNNPCKVNMTAECP